MAGKAKRKSKANPAVKKAGTPKAYRRAFDFDTHGAQLHIIEFRGKKRVIKPQWHNRKDAERAFHENKVIHSLFPENTIEPVGVKSIIVGEERRWGVVSKILKGRSSDYKEFQKRYYKKRPILKWSFKKWAAARRHQKFVEQVGVPFSDKVAEETGIMFNRVGVNVCNVNGRPVFFEASIISPGKLARYIDSLAIDDRSWALLKYHLKNAI